MPKLVSLRQLRKIREVPCFSAHVQRNACLWSIIAIRIPDSEAEILKLEEEGEQFNTLLWLWSYFRNFM